MASVDFFAGASRSQWEMFNGLAGDCQETYDDDLESTVRTCEEAILYARY